MNIRLATTAGDIGVRSFFVLSGFLITTLLLREKQAHGAISLTRFYLRRACRIFPAFYAYLLAVGALVVLGIVKLHEGDFVAAATYTTNFHADRAWSMGHLWSLSVEEQFYVLWPIALVMLGLLRAWWFACAAIVAAPVFRIALAHWLPDHRDLADQAFPCVFDALATGCLLALAMPHLSTSSRCARVLASRWFWIIPAIGVAALAMRNPWIRYGAAMTLGNVGIAAVILRCVARPSDCLGRVLERPTLVWIGTLSYSLYLWQQLFLNRHSAAWVNQFPVNVVLALGLAIASHYIIERPFLRFNDRWRTGPSPRQALEISVLLPAPVIIDVSDVWAQATSYGASNAPASQAAPTGRTIPR